MAIGLHNGCCVTTAALPGIGQSWQDPLANDMAQVRCQCNSSHGRELPASESMSACTPADARESQERQILGIRRLAVMQSGHKHAAACTLPHRRTRSQSMQHVLPICLEQACLCRRLTSAHRSCHSQPCSGQNEDIGPNECCQAELKAVRQSDHMSDCVNDSSMVTTCRQHTTCP